MQLSKPYLDRVEALLASGGRRLLGLAGAPGSGKSTLAAAIQEQLSPRAQVVPMDGFHLANAELKRLDRAARKGAPDTFDTAGYAHLLRRLRAQRNDEIVYAPEFRREMEEAVAGALPIFGATELVITEGNYLLLDSGGWSEVASLLDEVWFVDIDDELRRSRLVDRHQHFGRSRQEALDWVQQTDEPNAVLINSTKGRADIVFRWD